MGKTFNTGRLGNGLAVDASGNVGIGGAANASYKLAVTGNTLGTGTAFDFFTSSGIGSSGVTGLLRVVTAGTSTGIAIGQANSSRYTAIQPNEHIIYNDDFFMRTSGAFPLSLGTNNTIRMTISSSGNVGIGTSSPSRRLVVNSGIEGISAGISGATYGIRFDNGGTNSPNMSTIHGVDSTLTGSYQPIMLNGLDVRFGTSDTERMRVTSAGNVLVGQSTADIGTNGWQLQAVGGGHTAFSINNNEAFIFNNRNTGTTYQIDFRTNSIERGAINVTDSGTTYTTNSDYRIKEDFKEINGLEKVSAIKVYDFKFKDMDLRTDGVIAHELQEVLPYAVTGEKDGRKFQGVDYSKIVPVLVKAIQELNAKVTALENK